MISRNDWDAVSRDGWSQEDQESIDQFIDEWGHTYDSVTDAMQDWMSE